METSINGYIVRVSDIGDTAQILMVLNKERIYNLYANGTRKPESKNGKFVKVGNFIECSIFLSPDTTKLSKLKKIEDAKEIEYKTYWGNNYYLNLMKLISNFQKHTQFSYKLIANYSKIDHKKNVQEWWLWSIAQIIKKNGHSPIVNKCAECKEQSNPIYSFEIQAGGLKCKQHAFKKNKKQSIEEIVQYIWLFSLDFKEYLNKSNKYIIPSQEKVLLQFMNNHMGIYLQMDKI